MLVRFAAPSREAPIIVAGYPAPYRVGISNLGFHFLYGGPRRLSKLRVERVFADIAPVTLETGTNLASSPVLLISVSYEEDYINLVRMLCSAGVEPLRSKR